LECAGRVKVESIVHILRRVPLVIVWFALPCAMRGRPDRSDGIRIGADDTRVVRSAHDNLDTADALFVTDVDPEGLYLGPFASGIDWSVVSAGDWSVHLGDGAGGKRTRKRRHGSVRATTIWMFSDHDTRGN